MDDVVAAYPRARLKVIFDNLNTHQSNDEWLKRHPLVTFHFTPTRASWLNQVGGWFSILLAGPVADRRIVHLGRATQHINAFICMRSRALWGPATPREADSQKLSAEVPINALACQQQKRLPSGSRIGEAICLRWPYAGKSSTRVRIAIAVRAYKSLALLQGAEVAGLLLATGTYIAAPGVLVIGLRRLGQRSEQ